MLLTQSTRASTPAAGHLIFIMRIVCQQRGGREEAASSSSSSGALFNGKGALLPSVAGADALQPCVGTRKERGGGKNESSQSSYWEINSG